MRREEEVKKFLGVIRKTQIFWILCIILSVGVFLTPQVAEAKTNKKANYVKITNKWKKVQNRYYRAEDGTAYYKTKKNGTAKVIFQGQIQYYFTNGYYVYGLGYDGTNVLNVVRRRPATKEERNSGSDDYVTVPASRDWMGGIEDHTVGIAVKCNKENGYLGLYKNNVHILSYKIDEYGELEHYVVGLNLKTGKVKDYKIGSGGYEGNVYATKRYLYGRTAGEDFSPKNFYIFDLKTHKRKKVPLKIMDFKVSGKYVYCVTIKWKDGVQYSRKYRMQLNGKKLKPVTKWTTKKLWNDNY
jgi:hypothetical protein